MAPLDQSVLAVYGKHLSSLAEELEAQLSRPDDASGSIVPDNAIGRLTRMEAIQSEQVQAAGRQRAEDRLRRVHKALAAIADGSYGSCVRCGVDIPRGRLDVMPESRLCMSCASRR